MDEHLTRDLLMTTAIFGLFAFVWFGWAQENPPPRARVALGIGAGLGGVLAIIFGILSGLNWGAPTALDTSGPAFRTYLILVGVEVVLAAAGGIGLGVSRWSRFVPVWVLLVVGVHFYFLAPVMDMPALNVLATLLVAAVVVTMALARSDWQPSFIAGAQAGVILLVFAGIAAVTWLTSRTAV
ncbi:hypothetical protein [Tessaracoccus antarcticus]|uniref:Uncharacterized protein n=1 Tax=Tessaracoccus antarcticus TaxID=2479848 RepID=A0A3M0GM53_9ACTN|nr:hypothetical protein [Tessaracoccus antarcticus]RMB62259.1 hypothetical protein EAX62_06795 [Tessaracoccus antarcticus]